MLRGLVLVVGAVGVSGVEPAACYTKADPDVVGVDLGVIEVEGSELRFMTVGDWGVVGCTHDDCDPNRAMSMAGFMGDYAKTVAPHFVLSVGDHFYQNGVNSTTSTRWNTTFNNLFKGTNGSLDVPFYSILGNHDWEPNEDNFLANYSTETWDLGTKSQIEFTSSQATNRFCLPAYYYTFAYKAKNGPSARFVGIDSIFIQECPGPHGREQPMCHGDSVPSQAPFWKWLEGVLDDAKEDFVIPFAHHPLISIGGHGLTNPSLPDCTGDVSQVMVQLGNLFLKKKVPFYISGHDHNTELFTGRSKTTPTEPDRWGFGNMTLISLLTGSFGKTDGRVCGGQDLIDSQYNNRSTSNLTWELRHGSVTPAYSSIMINKTHLDIKLLGASNTVLETTALQYSRASSLSYSITVVALVIMCLW